MEDQAPDIGRNYPSRGEVLGPAWNKVWNGLSDGKWNTIDDLLEIPEIGAAPNTLRTLLIQASNKGMLQKRYVKRNSRMRVQFRRTDV